MPHPARAGPDLTAFTPTTVTDRRALMAELRRTRERGFATCSGELEPDLWGVSAAVPDPSGRPVAVVSLWGPAGRVGPDRFAALGAEVRAAADRIAAGLVDPGG